MLQQLREFRDGSRPATVMTQIARGFSDAQLQRLAAFFAAQPK
jgi:sulfide dehydrogenase cytochrome subunit